MKSNPEKQRDWQRRGAAKYARNRRERAQKAAGAPKGRYADARAVSDAEREGRALVAARDAGRCFICGKPDVGLNWHHRLRRSQGGTWSAANGISACGSGSVRCHWLIHSGPVMAYARGWMVPNRRNPADYPVRRWDGKWFLLDDQGGLTRIGNEEARSRIDGHGQR